MAKHELNKEDVHLSSFLRIHINWNMWRHTVSVIFSRTPLKHIETETSLRRDSALYEIHDPRTLLCGPPDLNSVVTSFMFCSCLVCVVILCLFAVLCVHCCFYTLDAGLLARSQYSEGPATGHLDTGFPWFPCVYKQMLRWFPIFQVATTCFSCSPPDLNLLVTNFIFCIHVK